MKVIKEAWSIVQNMNNYVLTAYTDRTPFYDQVKGFDSEDSERPKTFSKIFCNNLYFLIFAQTFCDLKSFSKDLKLAGNAKPNLTVSLANLTVR